ncbi:MAG TPA: polysaccharide biosynthesis/export family protein [Fimbriiglobus sp.]|nr:polysaccharide biosynthesis/export family protein [Fimbriiglobus sp.]
MRWVRGKLRRAAAAILAGSVGTVGCAHTGHPIHEAIAERRGGPISLPPPGTVPGELAKVTLPEYVIEPPDVLWIEVATIAPAGENGQGEKDKKADPAAGRAFDELRSLPLQHIRGDHTVRPDGTVYLGVYGSLPVAGYTLGQAAQAIREAVARRSGEIGVAIKPETLVVILDVSQYNSKRYYVITDGGGAGEQIYPFPVTGSETVLDALANINGIPPVGSKRNVWVARRCPVPGQPEQILPVDYVGITQHGVTMTNYQIMPGDRVYVKAQRLVTIDTTLARIFSPIERIFGVTLLGTRTINQIQNPNSGFNNNTFFP